MSKKDGELTFDRRVSLADQDVEFEMAFAGTIAGDTLAGAWKSGMMDDIDVTGTRVAAAPFGRWELTSEGRDGTPRTRILVLNEDLTGTYEMRNDDAPISDAGFEDGTLRFKVEREFGGNTFVMEFMGKVNGDALEGEWTTPRGSRPMTGKKIAGGAGAESM